MAVLTGFAQRSLLYVLLAHLGAVSLVWNLLACVLHPFVPARPGTAVGRAVIAHVYRFFWATAQVLGMMRIDVAALEAIGAEAGGLIVAANHPTMLDALVLVSRLPRGACIMKGELMRNVFLGAGARLARYIRNDSPLEMIRRAVDCVREGGHLVMFPEGTRTVQRPLNGFRPGITLIAQLAQVPIQTVIIETDSLYLRKGWPIWRAPAFPIEIRVRLGERFAPEPDHQALLARLERYFRRELGT